MPSPKTYQRPYPEPEPRSFAQWCNDLGIACEGNCPDEGKILTYDEFTSLPDVRLIKVKDAELYNWWRKHGDVWGEYRTAKEWLEDFNWELVDPTEEDLRCLNLMMEHDQFWQWSSGKVEEKAAQKKGGLFYALSKLFTKK